MKDKSKTRLKNLSIQVVAILVINVLVILSFFQLSSVQTYLGRMLTNSFSEKTGYEITIEKVDIEWLDKAVLENVRVKDPADNEMISIDQVFINYRFSSLISDRANIIDQIKLYTPNVHLSLSDSVPLNITSFITALKKAYGPKKKKKAKPFIISNISIEHGYFTYDHQNRKSLANRFDYNHFGLDSINLLASKLYVVADTFGLNIRSFSAIETSTQLPIHNMSTSYEVSNAQMKFKNLNLEFGNSIIQDSIVFEYNTMADLSHFIDKVHFTAHFEKTKLATQDLKYFVPYFNIINDTLLFYGNLTGKIKSFNSTDFSLQFGKSNLKGIAYFQGLPDVYNTFIDVKLRQSEIRKKDLEVYITSEKFKQFYPIELATVNGSFTGYPKDFVAKASFFTSIGHVNTDLNLKLDPNPAKSKYSGAIKLEKFDLGKLFNAELVIGKATLVGTIKGQGITKSSADFKLESLIDEIYVHKYNYTNIMTNAHFSEELFDGTLEIDDPNLQFKTQGLIDFRASQKLIRMECNLKTAKLNALNIRADTSSISAKFKINIKGIALDSIIGVIDISELKATNNNLSYQVNNLELISELKNNVRSIVLYSDRVKLKMEGDFNLTTVFQDFNYMLKTHRIKFRNQSSEINDFYDNSEYQPNFSHIDFDFKLKNANPLLNLFDPLVYLSKNTSITGSLTTKKELNEIKLNFNNDTIVYNHNILVNNNIDLFTQAKSNTNQIKGHLSMNSESQVLRSGSLLDSLAMGATWKSDSIDFNAHIRQQSEHNVNYVKGHLLFKTDTTLLYFDKTEIQVLEQVWKIDKSNQIMFTKNKLKLSNFSINSGGQSISASGYISKTDNSPVMIEVKNVNMNNFNPLITNKLKGIFNGEAQISNIFTTPLFETDFRIDSFRVDDNYFGNLKGFSNWNQPKNQFDVNFMIERNNNKLINITGAYKPLGDLNALRLNAELINTDLKLVEPFTKLFTNIGGSLSGNIKITGALFKPVLVGSGKINDAYLTIDYLKSKLFVQGNWALDSNSVSLNNVQIKDENDGVGILEAKFSHVNFRSFEMNLKAEFEKLKILNTISKNNNYFYGTAIGSGKLSITGPFENIIISTQAKTEKGTNFYIPLSDTGSGATQEDFISFNSFTKEDEKVIVQVEDKVNLKNVTVNLDLEITPDAYAEIIFDLTAGDIIRGRGKGNLSLGIDTKGEFTVLGEYEFTEGAYNFTMYNIVNKEFVINPKSKITFSGDPYLATMEINADYKVNTSLAPIIDTVYQDLPELKRIYPTKVLLDLNGPLLSPDINFDIIIENYPRNNVNIDTEVRAFLNKIKNDEQEMNRQVFSLLVFRKFSPPNSFSTGGTLGSSVSEFVSNQLSYWISQMDENLTIDFDLGELDADALKTFQLRVSYAFMNGKLIVTRDGGFTDQNQEATISSVTGDWTVEYLLSEDGKLRIKIFKKTNYDQLSSSTGSNDELITGGFSLLFTTSFDSIKEIFNKNKSKKPKQVPPASEPKEAIKPDDENTP